MLPEKFSSFPFRLDALEAAHDPPTDILGTEGVRHDNNDDTDRGTAVLKYCGGDAYSGIADMSLNNTKEYATRNGLEVLLANSETFPTEPFFTPRAWLKLAFILDILQKRQHKWLVWLDCDVLVINLNASVEVLLGSLNLTTAHDFVVARDVGNSPFNTGVIFVRVTNWAVETTARALRLASEKTIREHGFWEQKALHKLYTDNAHDEQQKILVLQERWKINAFAFLKEERPQSFAWHRVNCRDRARCDESFRERYCHIHQHRCS